ncbi:MAG TPA: ABC transporter ATP-binding protein [Sulfolobales archaeon]|nr:ABC transporter ATP-binding protein [Sulfolobales archaeon]
MKDPILVVKNLKVSYKMKGHIIRAVRGVSFKLVEGESLCIVGESGCGKSTLGYAISLSLPPNAVIEEGEIVVSGVNILKEDPVTVRGRLVSLVPQDVGAALSPFNTMGEVFADVLSSARGNKIDSFKVASGILESLGFSDPHRILRAYPHELSGGMLQRVLIALALSLNPKVIIADEPTSMVDASLRKGIVDLINTIRSSYNVTTIIITHDIAITPLLCDITAVMYAGKIVEIGRSKSIIENPLHPYTKMLLKSIPRIRRPVELRPIPGLPPDLSGFIKGCPFAPRCPSIIGDICNNVEPKGYRVDDRLVYCHLYVGGSHGPISA